MLATSRLTVRPFVIQDGFSMTMSDRAAAAFHQLDERQTAFELYERLGGWTLLDGDMIVGSAGLVPLWPGVAHAWLLPSPWLSQYSRTVAVEVVRRFRELLQRDDLRRVQCTVQADHDEGRRFVEWLGFEPEALMRRYGPANEDHILYAWVRP